MPNAKIEFYETLATRRPYAEQAGHLSLLWNEVGVVVLLMFVGFSGMKKDLAEEAFYSLRSDANQRRMTKALALKTLKARVGDPVDESVVKLMAKLIKLFKALDKFSGVRNGAVHGNILAARGGKSVYWAINAVNKPAPGSTHHMVFERISKHVADLEQLEHTAVEVFNSCAEILGWPQSILDT